MNDAGRRVERPPCGLEVRGYQGSLQVLAAYSALKQYQILLFHVSLRQVCAITFSTIAIQPRETSPERIYNIGGGALPWSLTKSSYSVKTKGNEQKPVCERSSNSSLYTTPRGN